MASCGIDINHITDQHAEHIFKHFSDPKKVVQAEVKLEHGLRMLRCFPVSSNELKFDDSCNLCIMQGVAQKSNPKRVSNSFRF